MRLLEPFLILLAIVSSLSVTIHYYLHRGNINTLSNYIFISIFLFCLFCAIFLTTIFSQETILILTLCSSWLVFLKAAYAFDKCKTVADFLQVYKPEIFNYLVLYLFFISVIALIKQPTVTSAVYSFIWLILCVSFVKLVKYSRGDLLFFQASLTIQVCLWVTLISIIATDNLYEISLHNFTWKLNVGGKLNLSGVNSISDQLVRNFGGGLIYSYLYFVLGLLYHGLITGKRKQYALKSYAFVLILSIYQQIPTLRDRLSSDPLLGKYISSPSLLLMAVFISMVPFIHSLSGSDESALD